MKKLIILLAINILFISSCVQSQPKNKELQEFVLDLSSANVKLRGTLMLFGEFKDDLSKLTYNRYIELLKENKTKSNEGVVELIQSADKHLFAVKKNSFLIAIYSKHLNAVLFDDASTAFTDSIIVLNQTKKVPELNELILKSGFKVINE
jgi:hypothetical protein